MIQRVLKDADIPCPTHEGNADFYAAGRQTCITVKLRKGTSLVVARELPRHSDVKMTMRYAIIGVKDQARGIKNLPSDSRRLQARDLDE